MIVGIDPSLSCTAVVAGIRPAADYISSFTSRPIPGGVLQRLTRYDELVTRIVAYMRGLPKITGIYIESYSHASKHGSHYLGEFGGILRWHLVDFGPVWEIAPTTLKKFAWGKGNGDKAMVCASLARRYNLDLNSNDQYDAYAAWRLGCVAEGLFDPTTEFEREAAATVRDGHNSPQRKGA